MTFIIDTLYLGSYEDVNQQKPSFQCIYNFAKECEKAVIKREFEYYEVPLTDTYSQKILPHLNEIVPSIVENVQKRKVVLLHCYAGKSRSACFAIAYLMSVYRMSLSDAYTFVKNKRKIIPNISFMEELMQYETQLFGSSSFDIHEFMVQFIVDSFDLEYEKVKSVFAASGQDYDQTIDKLFAFSDDV